MSEPTITTEASGGAVTASAEAPQPSLVESTSVTPSTPTEQSTSPTTTQKENEEGKVSSDEETTKVEKQTSPSSYQPRKGKQATWNNNNNNNRRNEARGGAPADSNRREPRRKKDFVLETQAWPSLAEVKGRNGAKAKSGGNPQNSQGTRSGSSKSKEAEGRKKKGVSWVPFKDVGQAQNPRHKFNNHGMPVPGQTTSMAPNPNAAPFTPAHMAAPAATGVAVPSQTSAPSLSPPSTTTLPTTATNTGGLNPNTANFFPNNNRQKRQYTNNNNRGNYRGRPNNNNRRGGGGMGRYPTQFPEPFYGQFNRFYPSNFYPTEPLEGEALKEAIRKQVEYYFSVDNLCKDIYLRSKMDKEGYVAVDLIAAFNKVKFLVKDRSVLIDALLTSTVLEFDADKQLLRKKNDWRQWLPSEGTETAPGNKNEEDEKTAKGENDSTKGQSAEKQEETKEAGKEATHNDVDGTTPSPSSSSLAGGEDQHHA